MDDNDAREEKRRQPVKRACNECRQQKVSLAYHKSSRASFSLTNFFRIATAPMRCHSRPMDRLFEMPSTEARL